MKPSSEKAKSASKVSSRGSLEGHGKSVPKLRFPGFKEEWENKQLCNECVFFSGGTPASTDAKLYNGAIPFIRSAEIDNTTTKLFLSAKGIAESSAKEVRTGDLLLAMYGANSGDVALSKINGAINQAILCIRSETINTRYLKFLLERDKKRITSRYLQGGQGNLSAEIIRNLRLMFPSQREQESISRFIEMVESRIVAQRKLVELLKKQKRGLIEQIFGLRLPVGDSVKEWKTVELRDLFTKVARRNRDGKVKNVITNSAEFGLIPQKDFFDKSIAVDGSTDGYYVIRTGDFVYNPRKSTTAPFGPFNRYTGTADGIISPLYTCLVPKGNANPEYLAWYFQSTAWHRYVYDNGSQGARHDRVNMTDDLLFGIPVLLSSIMVQAQITDCLNAIDARWAAATEMLKQIEQIKRGLLQQMFA